MGKHFLILMLKDIRFYLLVAVLAAFLVGGCSSSNSPTTAAPAPLVFGSVALTANTNGYSAANVDTNLKDAWGMALGSSGGFWVTERTGGSVELFDSTGKTTGVRYFVAGSPTGIVSNSADSFHVGILGSAQFIFAGFNGTISALPQFQGTSDSTKVMLDRSGNSSYTGLAIARGTGGLKLFATNIKNQSLDVIDAAFAPGPQLTDKNFSQNYTPFNAVVIGDTLYVTHAQRAGAFVQVGAAGAGLGIVDVYDLNATWVRTLIPAGGKLNSPWGLAIAPASFGTYAGKLLVGNFGDGTINVYDKTSGTYAGTLSDASGKPIVIDGLWSIVVSNGTLYYTSGPKQGADGEFGKIAKQ